MDKIPSTFRERKFFLAAIFTGVGGVALFTGHLTGGEFIALSGSVLALYGAAKFMDRT